MGAYDIEKYVPKDLFIDFRDFYVENKDIEKQSLFSNTKYDELAEYLIKFPKEKYIEMTEKAFEWEKTRKFGSLKVLENIYKELERKKDEGMDKSVESV